jgi:hypothetical protein
MFMRFEKEAWTVIRVWMLCTADGCCGRRALLMNLRRTNSTLLLSRLRYADDVSSPPTSPDDQQQ